MPSKDNIPDLSGNASFNVRVAPAARFALEWCTIVEGLSITKLMERGVYMFADDAQQRRDYKGWKTYWEQSDGSPEVALCLLYADKSLRFDETRQDICNFLHAHERFFFEKDGRQLKPKRRYIETLWPHVASGYLPDHWKQSKAVDAWRTGDKMAEMLRKSHLKPPAWGVGHE